MLGVAAAGGAAEEPSYSPGVLVALPWGSAGVGSVIHHEEARMREPCGRFGAFLEAPLVALPLHETAYLDVAARLSCFAWVAGLGMQVDDVPGHQPSLAGGHA